MLDIEQNQLNDDSGKGTQVTGCSMSKGTERWNGMTYTGTRAQSAM